MNERLKILVTTNVNSVQEMINLIKWLSFFKPKNQNKSITMLLIK